MLSKPNVNDMMPKVGNRYEVAIAVAKRARKIADKRLQEGDKNIKDPVDVATFEIFEEKTYVKKDGKFVVDVTINDEEEATENDVSEKVHAEDSVSSVINDVDEINSEIKAKVADIASEEKPKTVSKKTGSKKVNE